MPVKDPATQATTISLREVVHRFRLWMAMNNVSGSADVVLEVSFPDERSMATEAQIDQMNKLRAAAKVYGEALEALLPDGADKTYVIRKHRENAMWANVAITREQDGTPRA